MYRSTRPGETAIVCMECGAVVVDRNKHDGKHVKRNRKHKAMSVKNMIATLQAFPEDAKLEIVGHGYEVDSVELVVNVKDANSIMIMNDNDW